MCRYSGLNARPRLTLLTARLVEVRALVGQLVAEFDRLPSLRGPVACPADDGSQITAVFDYPSGHQLSVRVGLSGCAVVTNGSVRRSAAGFGSPPSFGPQLVTQLRRLLSGPPGSPAVSAATLAYGHWTVLARSPLGIRYSSTFTWDGRELLEIGGTARLFQGAAQDGAAAYSRRLRRWRRLAAVPAVVQPVYAASVWTGQELFVFGGPPSSRQAGISCCVAGLYDAATDRWRVSPPAPVDQLEQPIAVWTGRAVILAGLDYNAHQQLETASYDPAGNRWMRVTAPTSRQHEPLGVAMLATNQGVVLWSLWQRTQATSSGCFVGTCYGVDVLRLRRSGTTWANVTGSWPQAHTVDDPVFTGSTILLAPGQIWCGACSHPAPVNEHGYTADPRTLRLTPIPAGPLDNLGPQILWSGAAEISFNAGGEITGPQVRVLPGDIAFWDPATGRWARGPRAPREPGDAPAVWTGRALYVLARDGRLLAYTP